MKLMSRNRAPREFEVIMGQPWTINGDATDATTAAAALNQIYEEADLFPITIAVRGNDRTLTIEMDEYGSTQVLETPDDAAEEASDEGDPVPEADPEPDQNADQQPRTEAPAGGDDEQETAEQGFEETHTETTTWGEGDLDSLLSDSDAATTGERDQDMPKAAVQQDAQDKPTGAPDAPGSFAESFATRKAARRAADGPAEEGWRGGLNRSLSTKLRPGPHERKMRQLRARIQQGLDGSKTAMLANIKGGGTKTTNAFVLGAAIGRVRGGNVLSWDNNENAGNLITRGQRAAHGYTAIELYDQLAQLSTLENVDKLTHYMHAQGDNRFEVLASQDVAGTKQVIDADAFRSMHSVLRTFYSMIFVDTGNATNATTWQATAETADVIVLTMQNTEDSANGAAQTLDAIRRHVGDEKVANAVAVITQTANPSKERIERIRDTIGAQIRSVHEVPFDRALKEGEEILWESLQEKTREAYLDVAAAVVDGVAN